MKNPRKRVGSMPTVENYLTALDRLGLRMPVVNLDHIPIGDEFDDCLTVVHGADVVIHDEGRPVAVLVSAARYERFVEAVKIFGRRPRS